MVTSILHSSAETLISGAQVFKVIFQTENDFVFCLQIEKDNWENFTLDYSRVALLYKPTKGDFDTDFQLEYISWLDSILILGARGSMLKILSIDANFGEINCQKMIPT